MNSITIAIAQLNLQVGDLNGNAQKIIESAHLAYQKGARLVITSELSICAYAAEDLFLRPAFINACDQAVLKVANALANYHDLWIIIGHPTLIDSNNQNNFNNENNLDYSNKEKSISKPKLYNSASIINQGKIIKQTHKSNLPNYQVFDEKRYFASAEIKPCIFEIENIKIALLICEDAWFEAPLKSAKIAGANAFVVINASPFHLNKAFEREEQMKIAVKQFQLPLIYAHAIGAQDELIFDGASFALQFDSTVAMRAKSFQEELMIFKLEHGQDAIENKAESKVNTKINIKVNPQIKINSVQSIDIEPHLSNNESLWKALVLSLRDYVNKNRFPSVLLGLSGGIDSALVLALAVDALGSEKVRVVMMPSPYTASISCADAEEMAKRLNVQYQELNITPLFESFKTALSSDFKNLPEDATEENLQARIRGTLLMAFSNKLGGLLLTTGNKSELATGYCTLYGDMAGGFALIKDLLKTQVFELAKWRNQYNPFLIFDNPIPERIIIRPPSAELKENQTDQDNLPPYELLDEIIHRYMENNESIESLIHSGLDESAVMRVTKLIKINEYKRRQAPIGPRLTYRSFGKDWRYPITNGFY